jgi:hypothetical protein
MDKKLINQIIARLDRIEKIVLAGGSKPRIEMKHGHSSSEGLPAHILKLRDEQFFREPKIISEVQSKLKGSYHCEPDRVAMALLRLQRRKQLRKDSKIIEKKKQAAYTW